jgi:hypothetical protein
MKKRNHNFLSNVLCSFSLIYTIRKVYGIIFCTDYRRIAPFSRKTQKWLMLRAYRNIEFLEYDMIPTHLTLHIFFWTSVGLVLYYIWIKNCDCTWQRYSIAELVLIAFFVTTKHEAQTKNMKSKIRTRRYW